MKAMLRFVFIFLCSFSSVSLLGQYWSENFEPYTTFDKSLKYGYGWANTFTATGAKSIEARSLVSGTISPNTPASFTTGFFTLENKKYTVNFQHKSSATIVSPLLKVLLVDMNNTEVAELFTYTYTNTLVQLSSFTINGYEGWYKLRFHFGTTDAREAFQCGLDNINSTIPVNPETNSSVILSDLQTSITMESPAPDKQIVDISFTNLGPDASFIDPASGTAVLTDLKNITISHYIADNLQFDPVTKQIIFTTHTSPSSLAINNRASLRLVLQQSANTPIRLQATIDNISFQKDPNTANNSASLIFDGSALPPNWKKIEVTALNKDVHIYWETLIEVNAHHYNIQRSEDGVQFINVGTVLATNNAASNSYHYNDYSISTGKDYFYRLQLVNNNGASTFSSAHRINIPASGESIKIYPTLVKAGATVTATVKQPGTYVISLLRSNTAFIMSQEAKTVNNKINVSLSAGLKPGIYYMRITHKINHESVTQPFIVNH
jgi:hypothetical protein